MRDFTGTSEQLQALTVGCRYCKQPIGAVCVDRADGGRPLTRFPGHTVRVNDAAHVAAGDPVPMPAVDRTEAAVADLVDRQRAAAPPVVMGDNTPPVDRPLPRDPSEPSYARSDDPEEN